MKRRKLPGDVARDGEVLFIPMEAMHRPATLKLSDAQGGGVTERVRLTEVAGPIEPTRDGGSSPSKTKDSAPAVPEGMYRDPYGRLLVASSGNNVAAGRALGSQLTYEQRVGNAWKETPLPLPEPMPATYSKAKSRDAVPTGDGQEVYEQRLRGT